jgi:hypothetical protein
LAGEAGIRQFLDIGAGLPTIDNTHEIAQQVAPESRVVYVDNDPLVVVHARALQFSIQEGAVDAAQADLREPADILARAARTLDFRQPAAVLLLGVLWHVLDDGEAASIIGRLMGPLAAGSYLAIERPTLEVSGPKMAEANRAVERARHAAGYPLHPCAARILDWLADLPLRQQVRRDAG